MRPARTWRPRRCARPACSNSSSPPGSRCTATGTLAVHVDVDVLDFTDAPLAENTDGRNMGPTLDQTTKALTAAARDQRMRTLSIGELNPTRCAGDPAALARFVTSITRVLAATIH